MLQANRLKQAFLRGGPTMGLWQMLPGTNISRTLARTPGVDWVMVDCEHGQMNGMETLQVYETGDRVARTTRLT